jgi:hypothetical protein
LNLRNEVRETKKLELLNGEIEVEDSNSSYEDNDEQYSTIELD